MKHLSHNDLHFVKNWKPTGHNIFFSQEEVKAEYIEDCRLFQTLTPISIRSKEEQEPCVFQE